MESPHRIILHNPYDKESLIATMYSRVVEILIKSSNGWDSEKVNIIDTFKKIVKILLASEPGLESEELKELENSRNRILHLLDSHIQEEPGKLDTARDILGPLLIPSSLEEHPIESSDIDDLLKQDKRSLAEQVLALKKRVAQLENDSYENENGCYNENEEQSDTRYFLRERSGRKMQARASNIDLREEVPGDAQFSPYSKDGVFKNRKRKEDNIVKPCDKQFVRSSNSFLEDFVIIITAMIDLGFFVHFDKSIRKVKEDIQNKQKPATKRDVFYAIGNAVNLNLSESYDSYFERASKTGHIDTSVFDRLKEMIREEEIIKREKREKKENKKKK